MNHLQRFFRKAFLLNRLEPCMCTATLDYISPLRGLPQNMAVIHTTSHRFTPRLRPRVSFPAHGPHAAAHPPAHIPTLPVQRTPSNLWPLHHRVVVIPLPLTLTLILPLWELAAFSRTSSFISSGAPFTHARTTHAHALSAQSRSVLSFVDI